MFDSLTAYQNVKMGLELHAYTAHEVRTRATAMLTTLGLAHRMHAKPQALSGGQRQRVAVARALVHRPKLVLISDVLVQESVAMCAFLARCPAFVNLTPNTLSAVVDKMTQERHPVGTVLIRQGEVGDKFYLIRRGRCEVSVVDGVSQRVVNTLAEGDSFGEIALLTGAPRSATVVTTDATEVYTLGKDDFDAVLATSASFQRQ